MNIQEKIKNQLMNIPQQPESAIDSEEARKQVCIIATLF